MPTDEKPTVEPPDTAQWSRHLPILGWSCAFLVVISLVIFRSGGTMPAGNEMSQERALFHVINSVTLTGFQTSSTPDGFNWPGQWTIIALTVGGAIALWTASGIMLGSIVRAAVSTTSLLLIAGTILIGGAVVGWSVTSPNVGPAGKILAGLSAVTCSGVWIGPEPRAVSTTTLVLLAVSVVGALGPFAWIDLFRVRRGSGFGLTSLSLLAIAMLVGMGLVLIVGTLVNPAAPIKPAFVHATVTALNARGVGLPVQYLAGEPRPTQWVIAGLMLLGGTAGGAAGGVQWTTLALVAMALARAWRGQPVGRTAVIATVGVGAYLLALFLGVVSLLAIVPELAPDRLAMLAVSAVTNTGLSHDSVAITGPGLYLMSALMLAGRLIPLAFLYWASTAAGRPTVPDP